MLVRTIRNCVMDKCAKRNFFLTLLSTARIYLILIVNQLNLGRRASTPVTVLIIIVNLTSTHVRHTNGYNNGCKYF